MADSEIDVGADPAFGAASGWPAGALPLAFQPGEAGATTTRSAFLGILIAG